MSDYKYWNNIASQGMQKYLPIQKRIQWYLWYNASKGNCLDCNDDELKASIYFMLSKQKE